MNEDLTVGERRVVEPAERVYKRLDVLRAVASVPAGAVVTGRAVAVDEVAR